MQKAHFYMEAVSLVDKDKLNNTVSALHCRCGSYFKYLGVQSYLLLHLCLNWFAMVLYWPCCIKQLKGNKRVRPSLEDLEQASAKVWALCILPPGANFSLCLHLTYIIISLAFIIAEVLSALWVQGYHMPLPTVKPRPGSKAQQMHHLHLQWTQKQAWKSTQLETLLGDLLAPTLHCLSACHCTAEISTLCCIVRCWSNLITILFILWCHFRDIPYPDFNPCLSHAMCYKCSS